MAVTTTHYNSVNSVIHLDNASGTLTDVQGSSYEVTISTERTSQTDLPIFGGSTIVGVGGQVTTIDVACVTSTATDECWDIVKNWIYGAAGVHDAARSFQFDTPDATTGSDRFTGEAKIVNASVPLMAAEGGPVQITFQLKVDGALTHAEIS